MKTTTKETENRMVEMFNELKAKHPDAVVLFRVGDFYESYFDDAKKVSDILGLTLTKRNGENGYYLTGFPYHTLDNYLPKLIRAGWRVAICDDISEPAKLKKHGSNETTQEPQVEDAEAEEIKDDEQPQEPQTDEQPTETKSAKIIYTDKEAEDYTPKNGKTFELDELQDIVDGCIEIIRLNDGRMIIVDEDGKSKDKAVNIPATNILRRDHFTTDYIVGTAIVCDADMIELKEIMRLRRNINAVAALYNKRGITISTIKKTSVMEKFLKGKTLYIEDGKDGCTLRFVIANITRCENGVLAKSEDNGQMFIGQQCFEDLKKQGWHRQHHYCGICASMTEISIGN